MKYLIKGGSGLYPYPNWAENEIPHQRRLRFMPLSWLGGKWNTSSKEAQVYTLILIGGKWNTSSKEAQVCTLILIGQKIKYLIKGGSGLYPYPDWAENEIPHQRRLRFVPLSWLGRKWNTSSKVAQVCTLILIGQKMKYLIKGGSSLYPYPDWADNDGILERRTHDGPFGLPHNESDRGFAKGWNWGP